MTDSKTGIQQTRSDLDKAIEAVKAEPSAEAIEQLRIDFLGRKGKVTGLLELLRSAPVEEKPVLGKELNALRAHAEGQIKELQKLAKEKKISASVSGQGIDVSLPASLENLQGSLHPVSLMRQTLLKQFRRMGFSVVEGPEVDHDFYNFSALNFQDDHPARDMQDTFFVKDYPKTVLRTHTSNVQIHGMLANPPPLRMVCLGRTYRCDSDLTHTPMFHQIEGVVVDKQISLADLKGVVDSFLKAIYGQDLSTRLRPSYFPFVEPGGEVDLQCVSCRGKGCRICSDSGWLEIGGMGMIHPNVFESVNLDSETYTGFAFGFGIDRMAMLKYGIQDLRTMFEGRVSFQQQFPVHRF